jgi:folate-binding protein YgfZ
MTCLVTRLDNLAALEVSGADARDFLYAQLSSELPEPERGYRLSAWCSPQGRVLACPWVCAPDRGRFVLVLPRDLAEPIVKRLRMFVLRAKVAIAVGPQRLFGVIGSTVEPAATLRVTTDTPRALLAVAPDEAAAEWERLAEEHTPADESAWRLRDIRDGIPRIASEQSDHYLPQVLNLDALEGVSFTKGCFPGQEIVARLKYRGTIKRRLFIATSRVRPGPNVRIMQGEHAIGEVLDSVAADGTWYLSAVMDVQSASADAEPRIDGSAIHFESLPYSLDA